MAAEQILKSWLRQKYTDNNTLRTRYNSGDSLTVPDTSNSLADDTDINTLVTSLRKMQSNTYLRYSPLWSSVNINNVAQGDLIAQTKKTSIDNLMADLLAMCANNVKNPTGCPHQPNVPTAFGAHNGDGANFTSFTNNDSNVASFDQTCFYWGGNYGSNYRNTTRPYVFSTNFAQFAASFSRGGGTFSHRSGNVTAFGANALTFTQRFTASFVVKSDRSTTTHSNVVD